MKYLKKKARKQSPTSLSTDVEQSSAINAPESKKSDSLENLAMDLKLRPKKATTEYQADDAIVPDNRYADMDEAASIWQHVKSILS
ncbi:unnamed protein product [Ceutorhynchus assimilis]|uniref:Uncharacterized protein n=1 Tax=Ceutorhynchus assimilis TaxID=467358 RepID=A0A9N9QMQ4_9CUCU|nr:unnamed protein product [Ceutorhynchus assimilis]